MGYMNIRYSLLYALIPFELSIIYTKILNYIIIWLICNFCVSAYVRDTLEDSVKQLKRVVELIQKPFDIDVFIDTIEDIDVYEGLKNLVVNVRLVKDNNPTKKQINELIEGLRKIQKTRAF